MIYPYFLGGSNVAQALTSNQERTVNWYAEVSDSRGATSQISLYPTPGVTTLATGAGSPGRALFWEPNTERLFAVIGATFYEISSSWALTSRGTVTVDGNPATISSNGDGGGQLFITSGSNGYLFTLSTNTFASIAALAGKATMGDHLDGYFLALDSSTSTVYISDLLAGGTWTTGQMFFQRSAMSDRWLSMKVFNRYIYLLGKQTSEVWANVGNSPVPFELDPSGVIQWGCIAPFSVEIVGGALMWVAATISGSGAVLRCPGFSPQVVSTSATELAFQDFTRMDDAIGFSYEELGHTFYVLTFGVGNATWSWDVQTGGTPSIAWHERGTWNPVTVKFDKWRPLFHALGFDRHICLDASSGDIYELDNDVATDPGGSELRRLRRGPCIIAEKELLFFPAFEVDLETGLGLSSGQGSNPQMMMRSSDDGGRTWNNERWTTAGAIGEYKTRVRWNRCGRARQRVFEVSVSDPIPWRLTNAYIPDFEPPQSIVRQLSRG